MSPLFARLMGLSLVMGCVADAYSAGFQLDAINASSFGLANAGASADVSDASIVFHNPAGIHALHRKEYSGGVNYIYPNSRLSNVRLSTSNLPQGTQVNVEVTPQDFMSAVTVPSFFYTQPLTRSMAMGLAVTVPFGSDVDYRIDSSAGPIQSSTAFKVLDMQPAVSYAFSDALQLGASIHALYAKQNVVRYTPLPRSSFSLQGSDTAVGFGLGGLYTFHSKRTRIGLDYRSKASFRFQGRPEAQSLSVNFPTLDVTHRIVTPSRLALGVSHTTRGKLSIHAGVTRTHWSEFSSADVGITPPMASLPALQVLPAAAERFHFQDTTAYALGIRYQFHPQWQLRMGHVWDDNIFNANTSPYAPTLMTLHKQEWFTVGIGYRATGATAHVDAADAQEEHATPSRWAWDGVIGFMPSSKVKLFGQAVNSGNVAQTATIHADATVLALMVGLQVSYIFN